jgi:hypothetical protein
VQEQSPGSIIVRSGHGGEPGGWERQGQGARDTAIASRSPSQQDVLRGGDAYRSRSGPLGCGRTLEQWVGEPTQKEVRDA